MYSDKPVLDKKTHDNKKNSEKKSSIQDSFLNKLRKDGAPVAIYLVNGIKLQGNVESFDQFVVMLKNTVSQMVYKHAISTIVPAQAPRGGERHHEHKSYERGYGGSNTDGGYPDAGEDYGNYR